MENILNIIAGFISFFETVYLLCFVVLFLAPELIIGFVYGLIKILSNEEDRSFLLQGILKWGRILGIGLFVLFVVSSTALYVGNKYYFDPIIRFVVKKISMRTGIQIAFEKAEGNLLEGAVTLRNAHFKRENYELSNFDFKLSHFSSSVDIAALLRKRYVVPFVKLSGVEGAFERLAVPASKSEVETSQEEKKGYKFVYKTVLPSKKYHVGLLQVENLKLEIKDSSRSEPVNFNLEVRSLEANNLLSQSPLFSLFFEADVEGALNGSAFLISHKKEGEEEKNRWSAENIPLHLAKNFMGGPIRWIKNAELDLEVRSIWKKRDFLDSDVAMHWKFVMNGLMAEVPEKSSRVEKLIAKPIVKYMNDHSKTLPLEFGFSMNQRDFKGHANLESLGLFKVLKEAFLKKACELTGIKKDELVNKGKKGVKKLKSFYKKWKD